MIYNKCFPSVQALTLTTLAFLLGAVQLARAHEHDRENIISAIVSAPVVGNGIVADEPTEINIFLTAPGAPERLAFDAENFGHQIPAGGWMEIELGGSFSRNPDFAGPLLARAHVILTTGHPQNPIVDTAGIGVQHGNWSLIDDDSEHDTILMTLFPNAGSGADGLENERAEAIGFKVIHIRPNPNDPSTDLSRAPFFNGAAGTIGQVRVRIYDADGELIESGAGAFRFPAAAGPQVHITNAGLVTGAQGSPDTVDTELVESTNFQHVAPGAVLDQTEQVTPFSAGAPYAPRFLLFAAHDEQPDPFIPQSGIAEVGYLVHPHNPRRALLVIDSNGNGVADRDDERIGRIKLKGPRGGAGARILANPALTVSGDGVSGANGSVLNVPVQVGDRAGVYRLTVSLRGGGRARNIIVVDPAP